jgi:diguanylate cyclase (GGDEF)-like protein
VPVLPRMPHIGLAPRLIGLAAVAACLAGGTVAISVISTARQALRDDILQTHLIMADMVASQITQYVGSVENDAIDLAQRPEVLAAVQANDLTSVDPQLMHWLSNRREKVDSLSIYSTQGVMLATARANHTLGATTAANAAIIQHVAATGETVQGQPLRASSSGAAIVPIYAPIRSDSGNVTAVLSETLSLDLLTRTLLSLQLTPGARISVHDRTSGVTLVNEDPRKILTTDTTGRNAASRASRAGERGMMESARSNGEATLASFAPVVGPDWTVLLQEPSSEAFAPIELMTRQGLAWLGAAMLLAGLVAAGLAMSMVRPLRTLRTTAERMANGDLGRRTGVRPGDEIGDLGHAFDRMAERLQHSVEALTHQALSDTLTTLPNRVLLHQRLSRAIASGDDLALLIIDLDHFKEVNDTLGHPSGDALLQQLAARLRDAVRKSDTIARLGGDEFAIVLPGASQKEAFAIAESLLTVITRPFELNERSVSIGASVGIAVLPQHGPDADTLLRCADVAMYVAKRSGQGVAVYSPEQDQHSLSRLVLIADLREAIDRDELTLAFQPLVDCREQRAVGVEALVRWSHPKHGLIPPDQFVPLAEQTGLITRMSRWVLRSAVRQHCEWRRVGLCIPVSVNLSMRDLHDPGLPDSVRALLEEFGAGAESLRVEITESSLMLDPRRALQTLVQLREFGVQASIDDFGTGYSSLAYLKQLPAQELKIDRSFVRDLSVDDNDLAIVRSTIDLAHNLGLSVVAEGVEDEHTDVLLRRFGCDKAQGYLFSRPLPGEQLTAWLLERNTPPATSGAAAA